MSHHLSVLYSQVQFQCVPWRKYLAYSRVSVHVVFILFVLSTVTHKADHG